MNQKIKAIINKLRLIIRFPLYIIRLTIFKQIGIDSRISLWSHLYFKKNIKIGNRTIIREGVVIQADDGVSIGSTCFINPHTCIYGKANIGNDCLIGPNVMISGGSHNFRDKSKLIRRQKDSIKGVIIKKDVWIGANAVIVDGVKIGTHSVVGAGSVVTKDVPKYSVVAGNPAKILKKSVH